MSTILLDTCLQCDQKARWATEPLFECPNRKLRKHVSLRKSLFIKVVSFQVQSASCISFKEMSVPEPASMNIHEEQITHQKGLLHDHPNVIEKMLAEEDLDTGHSKPSECRKSYRFESHTFEDTFQRIRNVLHIDSSIEGYVNSIEKCKESGCLAIANHAYTLICETGLESCGAIGGHLVGMFVHSWSLPSAQQVFSRLSHRNRHTWNYLMQGYIEEGDPEHGLHLFMEMKDDEIYPNNFTFTLVLRACAVLKFIKRGQQIHTEIVMNLEDDLRVTRALLDFYVKCGLTLEACDTCSDLQALAQLHLENGCQALTPFELFGEDPLILSDKACIKQIPSFILAFVYALKACSILKFLNHAQELHIQITKEGIDGEYLINNTLIDVYAKCGLMSEALKILKGMSDRDVISWTALISGCLENGLCQDALTCMKLMEKESILPNAFTLVSLLKACSLTQDLDIGHKLYMQIMKEGLYTDFVICNSVVSMYAKCGSLTEACDVFYKFARQDIISWTSLISGYTDHGFYNEALNCFQSMEAAGVSPNTVSYNCSLKACAFTGNLKMGLKLHHDIVKEEFEKHSIVGNTLIHMYARCGFYQEAIAVFDDLPQHDVITWTTLIAELAEDGHGELALKKFDQMQARFFSPNSHTYVCVLKACACIGSIEKGRMLHIEITKRGLERNSYIIKALISMYAQCGKPICLG